MRIAVVAAVCACRFTPGVAPGGIDAPGPDAAPEPDVAVVQPFCDPADATLVACYELDGTTLDGSVHHLDPSTANNVRYTAGVTGQALDVETGTEIDIAETPLLGVSALTIEAWIAPMQLPTVRGGILDCDKRYGLFVYADGSIHCDAGAIVTGGVILPARWTHVACTNDGMKTRIYIDGHLTAELAATAPPLLGSQTGFTLGANNPPGGADPLGGGLDQVRLFSVARSSIQICDDAKQTMCM